MAKLKLGIAKLNVADLILSCSSIESLMAGNAHFPNPTPALAQISTKRTEVETWTSISSGGGKAAITRRNTAADELKNMLRKLSLYVSLPADGDENIILSSGFDIRKKPSPIATILRPAAVNAQRSDHEGKVKITWSPVKNAVNCQVEMATTDPNDEQTRWTTAGVTSKSKILVSDLKPGTYYWFRVKAFGRLHISGYSDPAMIMAA
jgi:hypothetical protein